MSRNSIFLFHYKPGNEDLKFVKKLSYKDGLDYSHYRSRSGLYQKLNPYHRKKLYVKSKLDPNVDYIPNYYISDMINGKYNIMSTENLNKDSLTFLSDLKYEKRLSKEKNFKKTDIINSINEENLDTNFKRFIKNKERLNLKRFTEKDYNKKIKDPALFKKMSEYKNFKVQTILYESPYTEIGPYFENKMFDEEGDLFMNHVNQINFTNNTFVQIKISANVFIYEKQKNDTRIEIISDKELNLKIEMIHQNYTLRKDIEREIHKLGIKHIQSNYKASTRNFYYRFTRITDLEEFAIHFFEVMEKFYDEDIYEFRGKLYNKSDKFCTYQGINSLEMTFKKVQGGGNGYLLNTEINELQNLFLNSYTNDLNCFFKSYELFIKNNNIDKNISIIEMRKKLLTKKSNIRLNNLINPKDISKMIKDQPFRIYVVDNKGFIKRKNEINKKLFKSNKICNLLYHENHFLLINEDVRKINNLFKKYNGNFNNLFEIVRYKENKKEVKNLFLNSSDIKNYEKKQKQFYGQIYYFDFETYIDENNFHKCYNSAIIPLKSIFYYDKKINDCRPKSTKQIDKQIKILEKNNCFFGENSLDLFVDKLIELNDEMKNKHETFLINKKMDFIDQIGDKPNKKEILKKKMDYLRFKTDKYYTIRLIGFNNAKFDNSILLDHEKIIVKNILRSNGILYLKIFDYIEILDQIRHTPGSLKRNCIEYEVDKNYSKTEFPHRLANELQKNMYNYECDINKINVNHFHNPDDYKSFKINNKNLTKFNFKNFSINYQILDCVSLCFLHQNYRKAMLKITNLDSNSFITSSSLSAFYCYQNILHKEDNKSVKIIKNIKIDQFIRKAVYGGFTSPVKKNYESETYEKWNELENEIKKLDTKKDKEKINKINNLLKEKYISCMDYEDDFDGVAMYPSAMYLYEYPCGKPQLINNEKEFEIIKNKLNKSEKLDKIYFIECDMKYTKPEKEKNDLIIPIIGEKMEHIEFENKDGKNIKVKNKANLYNLFDKNKIVYSSINIENAVRFSKKGWKVTKIYNIIAFPNKRFIFRDLIKKLFDSRLEAKKLNQSSKSAILKLIMNSIYGKFIESYHNELDMITSDNKKIDSLIINGKLSTFKILDENNALIKFKKELTNSMVKNPSYLGVCILDYSKRILFQPIEKLNGFYDYQFTSGYYDTDSMQIHKKAFDILKNKKSDHDQNIIGYNLGQFHDDLDGLKNPKIIKSIRIAPKTYILKYIGFDDIGKIRSKLHIRCKGLIRKRAFNLRIKDYEKMLNDGYIEIEDVVNTFRRNFGKNSNHKFGIFEEKNNKLINKKKWLGRKVIDNFNTRCWLQKEKKEFMKLLYENRK